MRPQSLHFMRLLRQPECLACTCATRCHHLPCRYHNFLSPAECEHLIKLAKGHMEESTVVDAGSGRSVPSR